MKGKLVFITFVLAFVLIICSTAAAANTDYNYTTDDDFNSGNSTGLNVSDNQIQLSDNSSSSAFPYIWVPNSNDGTVSKVDTVTGLEIAKYKVSPSTGSSPSRTTIDLDGSCWVCNRETGTVVKIGLFENGGYFDRNGNGIIETCRDLDGNGVITSDEILPWGQDECVLWEVVVISGREGTYRPGEYTGGYSTAPGPRGIAVDSQNNIWAGTYGTRKFYYINGSNGQILKTIDTSSVGHGSYGAVMDQYGILWSSGGSGNNILRLDPSNDTFTRINVPHTAYGLGLDRNNHLFVSGYDYSRFSRINILTGTIEWTKSCPYQSRGVVVTDDGDVWIANSAAGTVTRYSNDGVLKATIIVGSTPTGVSVDNQGKIWVVDYGDEYIHRINPNNDQTDDEGNIINGIELSKRIIGGTHYGYSDMTGVVSNTITTGRGTWTKVHDSQVNNALWGKVSWNSFEPDDTKIIVRVRSSNDKQSWSAWEEAVNGEFLKSTPRGRYLEVEVLLERNKGSTSPILYDLAVKALKADVTLTTTVDNPVPRIGDTIKFTTTVRNNGPDTATNVTVYPVIPAGFTAITPLVGTYADGVWTVGDLRPGETATLEVTGVITPEFASRNINYSVTESHNEYDPTNSSVSTASVYIPFSNVELDYSLKNGKPTLTVRNSGTDYAFNIAVQTAVPLGFIPGASQGLYGNGLWYIGALAPDGTATLTLTSMAGGNVTQPSPVNVGGYTKVSNKKMVQRGYYKYGGSIPPPENRNKTIPLQDTGVPLNFSGIAILLVLFGSYLNKREDKSKINKWFLLIIVLIGIFMFCGTSFAAGTNQTYNSSNDFNNGTFNNVNGSGDKLELSNSTNPAGNYIWVPNTNQGTISKVDVNTGQEVARYRTSPLNNANPSRTVVDSDGNCWVANYQTGTVVKIGLLENGVYIDRNNDGTIQTSRDLDRNGVITGSELLDWGKDECVLYEVVFIPGKEGVYAPGAYTGGYANNWANPGPLALVLDSDNNVWVGCYGLYKYFCIDRATGQILKTINVSSVTHTPYGAVIDQNGIIWSAGGQNNNILRLDTITGSFARINLPHWAYGVALDGNNHLFVTGYASSRISRIDTLTSKVDWTKTAPNGARGVIVTEDGDVWTANLESNTVTRFSNDGVLKATIYPGKGPSALSIDSKGNIWVVDYNDVYIHRINPEINGVDFSKMIVSGNHVGYSTMTTPSSNAYDKGTWTVIHDSLTNNAYWGTISWNSYEPKGTKVMVRVRSSNDKTSWSSWEVADNGLNLKLTPRGRYLEVEVTLEKFNSTQSPVVYDITVSTLDSTDLTTDLGVGITGNQSSLNVGDTVKLTVTAFNNGPNSANVKVNYKIPFGLKMLSSQGTGTYDSDTGVWNVGALPVGSSVTIELILQANDAGYFVNIATVYSDLASFGTKSLNSGMFRAFSVKAASVGDSNSGSNQASFSFTSTDPGQTSDTNTLPYDFPPIEPPAQPQPPNDPPTPPGPTPPGPQPPTPPNNPPQPTSQLARDVAGVRNAVSSGSTKGNVPEWNLGSDKPKEEINKEDPPLWLIGLILGGALLGTALVITPAGEYLKSVIMGQLESLSSMITASRWFTGGKYLLENLGTHLLKFAENIAFNSASTEGFWFNILGYLATLASPDIIGLLGTVCGVIGIALGDVNVFAMVGVILTTYGFYTLIKKYIFGE